MTRTSGNTLFKLVGDIGGTNARLALVDANGKFSHVDVLPCAGYPHIADAIADYLRQADAQVNEAALAIACPIEGDEVRMTNHHWRFSTRELQQRLGLSRLLILNDFVALAMAVPFLPCEDVVRVGNQSEARPGPIGVIGPGTGLGVSYLVPGPAGWLPQATEGGHVSLAANSQRERDVLAVVSRSHAHVSAERLLSGSGLPLLYQALCVLDGVPTEALDAGQLFEAAHRAGNAQARETFALFSRWLGSVAGNLALTLGCKGGVFLGGGILLRIGDLFDRTAFRAGFEAKGRFESYLNGIPTFLITTEFPALIGTAAALGTGRPRAGGAMAEEAIPAQNL